MLIRVNSWITHFGIICALGIVGVAAFVANAQENSSVVSILVSDSNGYTMVETSLEFKPDWTSVMIAEPLKMEHEVPLSVSYDRPDNLVCDVVDPATNAAMANYQVLLKYPGATTRCPFPLHPSGLLFKSATSNGGEVYLRIQDGFSPAELIANCGSERYSFESITPYEFAKAQIDGEDHGTDTSSQIIEFRVSEQDCKSLIAYQENIGQRECLIQAAEITSQLIELYRDINGVYPATMCQLYTGPDRVIADIPHNPYVWEKNLCASEDAHPRPRGAVDYMPQREDGAVVGYWLAVLGEGETSEPRLAVPSSMAVPLRAIAWFESHP